MLGVRVSTNLIESADLLLSTMAEEVGFGKGWVRNPIPQPNLWRKPLDRIGFGFVFGCI